MIRQIPTRSGHQHPLSIINRRDGVECDVCNRSYYRHGLSCKECKITIHKKCAFVFKMPQKIFDHPSHDHGHAMGLRLLTTGAPPSSDPECHICGKDIRRVLYHCTTCNLSVHIDCMIGALCNGADGSSPRQPPFQAIMDALKVRSYVQMPWHPHPLFNIGEDFILLQCDVCDRTTNGLAGYFCLTCRLMVHEEKCAAVLYSSPEITSHCHAKHPLKLLVPGYTDLECHICGDHIDNLLYHCDFCKFNLDIKCALRSPPEATLSNLKVHEHTLTLIARLISFVCDACGEIGDRAPYVCLQCARDQDGFMVHRDCAFLPRVIQINCHEHRVSYTYPIGLGEWKCGFCLEELNWSCGAYSCALCHPNYVIHSRCATREDVWNIGEELDGVPEEVEDVEPFKPNGDNTITHFAHDQHNMSLNKDGIALEESIVCGACVRPISSNTFYNCSDCNFILHEICANLSKKKRLFLNPKPLVLNSYSEEICCACFQRTCKGFMYTKKDTNYAYDLICSSITIPFTHGSHPHHPLLFIKLQLYGNQLTCNGCNMDTSSDVLGCTKCNYFLDFRCATLPTTVTVKWCDDHPLNLCYGKKTTGKYWCDICETRINPDYWFYLCKDCGSLCMYFVYLGISGTPNQEEGSPYQEIGYKEGSQTFHCCQTIVLHDHIATIVNAVAQVPLFLSLLTIRSCVRIIVT